MLKKRELDSLIEDVKKHCSLQYMFVSVIPSVYSLCESAEKVYYKGQTAEKMWNLCEGFRVQIKQLIDGMRNLEEDKAKLREQLQKKDLYIANIKKSLPKGILKNIKDIKE